jgi:RNA polymerase sigma-70 factor (ECF subfamily)
VSTPKDSHELVMSETSTESPEVALVRRAQSSDRGAFSDLVRIYQRRAVSVAYRLLSNTEDACDVAQEAFVRAFRNLGQLENPARFGPWLMRTVSNLSLNFRRARQNRQAGSLDDAIELESEVRRPASGRRWNQGWEDETGPLPEELEHAIGEAIATLPDKQRLALILFSVEGMPQKEVADILECSVELVKWNVFQARKRLKELLKDFL